MPYGRKPKKKLFSIDHCLKKADTRQFPAMRIADLPGYPTTGVILRAPIVSGFLMWYNLFAFVALVKPLDLLQVCKSHTCGPFFIA
jgi:hypothetical protein